MHVYQSVIPMCHGYIALVRGAGAWFLNLLRRDSRRWVVSGGEFYPGLFPLCSFTRLTGLEIAAF